MRRVAVCGLFGVAWMLGAAAAAGAAREPAAWQQMESRAVALLDERAPVAMLQLDFADTVTTTPPPDARAREEALEVFRREERSARAAIVMSLVFPGWGQLYADAPFWSAIGFGVQMYYLGNILLERRRVERQRVLRDREEPGSALRASRDALVEEHKERIRDYIWWSAGGFLILSLDAYVSVQLVDFDSDDPPTPDLDRDWDPPEESGAGLAVRLDFPF